MKKTVDNLQLTANTLKKNVKCQPGQIIIISLIFLVVVMIMAGSLFKRTAGFLRVGGNFQRHEQAISLAEAGIDYAIGQLNETAGGYSGTQTSTLSTGEFTVTVTDSGSALKKIASTGYVPSAAAARNKQTIKVDATISTEQIAFRYAMQVGDGGIIMENSATINGNVYSNATDAQTSPNKSIQGSGSSKITGDAFAVGTISSPDPTVTGIRNTNQPPSEMPIIDLQPYKDAATAGGTVDCTVTACVIDSTQDIGPKKYDGKLTIQGTAIVSMKGPVWVTEDFLIQNSAILQLDTATFGSSGTVFVVGDDLKTQNSSKINPTTADPPGYILMVSEGTGTDITIENSGQNAIFYILNGTAELQNQAQVNALVAKKLLIKNSATVNYNSGLASTQFSSGPGAAWVIKKGTYRFANSP